MNRILRSILLLGGLIPSISYAQVNVTLHKDIEAIIVNGEELPMTLMSKNNFMLENGQNQLVVRLSKLVSSGSEFEKFKSDPLVITFATSDEDIFVEPTRNITSERQIKDFKQNPSFELLTPDNRKIESQQDILPKKPGFMRNYGAELAAFNAKKGDSLLAKAPLVEKNVTTSVPNNHESEEIQPTLMPSSKSVGISSENSLILLQADFLRMSPKQQQKFLQWAVENVRS
ncbi:DUF2057 family protein [Enterovibrio paralichthyis]|uniref:YccT family protein n=1 Tax=Enterovibrio paralichthyis TaxID=2853805 RepID=UPI001C49031A|nr:DUF2057 domain-containing protein [Enterovibrio paralichthyis]MBV7298510.1 DUF2057 domain-containing protein [Enterovibrio paralichthyis]